VSWDLTVAILSVITSALTVILVAFTVRALLRSSSRRATSSRRWVAPHARRTAGGREVRVRGHYLQGAEPSWLTVLATTLRLWADRRRGIGRRVRVPDFPGRVRPGRSACGLTDAAAFFLPRADRARYAAEYRSELWDLAQSGAGHLRQLLYALRQFRAAVPLVFVLRSLRRKGVSS
jgi:hypothetical protein